MVKLFWVAPTTPQTPHPEAFGLYQLACYNDPRRRLSASGWGVWGGSRDERTPKLDHTLRAGSGS